MLLLPGRRGWLMCTGRYVTQPRLVVEFSPVADGGEYPDSEFHRNLCGDQRHIYSPWFPADSFLVDLYPFLCQHMASLGRGGMVSVAQVTHPLHQVMQLPSISIQTAQKPRALLRLSSRISCPYVRSQPPQLRRRNPRVARVLTTAPYLAPVSCPSQLARPGHTAILAPFPKVHNPAQSSLAKCEDDRRPSLPDGYQKITAMDPNWPSPSTAPIQAKEPV